jgi:hypothetical protein
MELMDRADRHCLSHRVEKERVSLSRQRTEASIALSLKAKTGRQADQRKRIKAGSLEGSKEATNQKLITHPPTQDRKELKCESRMSQRKEEK